MLDNELRQTAVQLRNIRPMDYESRGERKESN